jgi:hypothetical protein
LDDGLPGAAKNTGDESRLYVFFTLPLQGRVKKSRCLKLNRCRREKAAIARGTG